MAKTKKAKPAAKKKKLATRAKSERRDSKDRRTEEKEAPVKVERRISSRRKVQRRRQIDPTTCERDYTPDEVEFMDAMDSYKRSSGRMFPTCSEILEVLQKIGYQKVGDHSPQGVNSPQPVNH